VIVSEGSLGEEVKLQAAAGGGGFVKRGFRPKVKKRGSCGWAEWWNGKEEEVAKGIDETEMEELVPECGW